MEAQTATPAAMKTTFLIINCIILFIGFSCGPLVMRLYFIHGGKRIWFSSWLVTGGWPICFFPLLFSYTRRRSTDTNAKLIIIKPRVFFGAAVIGVFTGLDDYMYAYGVAKLPVSTSTLIIATQLAFTAVFAFLLVKQKFTAYSINAVVLLTVGAVVLGLHSGGDRPKGESNKEYWLGFFLTGVAAVLYGFILPLIELLYKKAKQELTYPLVVEIQLVMCFFATAFCTVGMIINNDFQAIAREAKEYELGEIRYFLVVVWSSVVWNCFFLGAVGVIYYASSLLSAVVMAVGLPVTELLAVIFYHEQFKAEKGISLFLAVWGFISYFFGEIKQYKKNKGNLNNHQTSEVQLRHQNSNP